MKNSLKYAALCLLMINNCFAEGTPADAWYAGMFLLASYVPPSNFILPPAKVAVLNASLANPPATIGPFPPLTNPFGHIRYKVGAGFGGQVGYRWCGYRLEGELLYAYNTFNRLSIDGYSFSHKEVVVSTVTPAGNAVNVVSFPYSMSGHVQLAAGLVNFYYDFYNKESKEVTWYPYVGLGFGYANIQHRWIINVNQTSVVSKDFFYTGIIQFRSTQSSPIGQAIIGLGYQLDDYFSLNLDYRFLTTATTATRQSRTAHDNISFQTLNFGFNYWFDCEA